MFATILTPIVYNSIAYVGYKIGYILQKTVKSAIFFQGIDSINIFLLQTINPQLVNL